MPSEKMELEHKYFTSSNFSGNNLGYNPNPENNKPRDGTGNEDKENHQYIEFFENIINSNNL